MSVDHHPLIKEFPALRERLHALKQDAHFANLEHAYEDVDKQIVRLEDGVERCGEAELEALKKQRLALKDQIYARLKAA